MILRRTCVRTSAMLRAATRGRLDWRREIVLVGLLYLVYEGSRLVPSPTADNAVSDGRGILRAERFLHIDVESHASHWLDGLPAAIPVGASYWYELFHYVVTPAVLIWLFRRHGAVYPAMRTALAAMTLPALVVFWLLPTAPPRLLPGAGVVDVVVSHARWGWWSSHGTAPAGLNSVVNVDAAMPSLHVGWALWCGIALFRYSSSRTLRVLGVVYPLGTALVVIATGNHYVLDVVAGVLLAVATVVGSDRRAAGRRLLPRLRTRRAVPTRSAAPAGPPPTRAARASARPAPSRAATATSRRAPLPTGPHGPTVPEGGRYGPGRR